LITPTGNLEKGVASAQAAIDNVHAQRQQILADLSRGDNAPTVNPVDLLEKSMAIAQPAVEGGVALGKSQQAQKIIKGIIGDAKAGGLDKNVTIDQLPAVTKMLDPDGKLFAKGAFISKDDALDDMIRKDMYFNVLDHIEKTAQEAGAPDIRDLGRQEKNLIDAKAAISNAVSRNLNKNPITFQNEVTAGMGAAGGMMAHMAGADPVTSVGLALATMGIKKAGEQGRAAALLTHTGRGLGSAGNAISNVAQNQFSQPLSSTVSTIANLLQKR
jgi:hypothetical protein